MTTANSVEVCQIVQLPPAAGEPVEEWSLEGLFEQQRGRLRRVAAGMGLEPVNGDDVLQEVYLEAARRLPGDKSRDAAVDWLVRVTVDRCLLEYRRRRRHRQRPEGIVEACRQRQEEAVSPEQRATQAEEVETMRKALRELDDSLQGCCC